MTKSKMAMISVGAVVLLYVLAALIPSAQDKLMDLAGMIERAVPFDLGSADAGVE